MFLLLLKNKIKIQDTGNDLQLLIKKNEENKLIHEVKNDNME